MTSTPRLARTVRRSSLVVVGLMLLSTAVAGTSPTAAAAPGCAAFTSKIYDQLNPTTAAQGLSATAAGFISLQAQGFTATRPYKLTASPKSGPSLKPVHRLYRAKNRNYFYSLDPVEIARATRSYGYTDQGVQFYASTTGSSCLQAVRSFYHPQGHHRFVTSATEEKSLADAGWRREKVRFYLGTPATAAVFTIAVIPDTQQEVLRGDDTRFAHRTNWLVAQKDPLDTRFATHTGDIVGWDTPDHIQYVRARDAMELLRGKIPFSMSVGNHDTDVVKVGGSAADPSRSWILIRQTPSFNAYLNRGTEALNGQFEAGKLDNTFHTFSGGGLKWLVLNLEMYPRRTVVAWAKSVVAANPHHNVVIATHSYLDGRGAISKRSEYGETTPEYLFNNLVKQYPNVKLVLSGHAGIANQRQDVGAKNNQVNSFLTTMHDNHTNPLRILEINVKANTVAAFVYAPFTNKTYPSYVTNPRTVNWTR